MIKEKTLLVSGSVVYKRVKEKPVWFVSKLSQEADWELPKTPVRKGESSVRASLRAMAEQGGMRAKVLEEVGRSGGAALLNGKTVPQRHIYYLLFCKDKDGGEILGFADYQWLDYGKALKKLTTKREIAMLKDANLLLKDIDKKRKAKKKALGKGVRAV